MAFLPGYASKVLANEQVVCATVSAWTAHHQRAVSEVTAMCQGSALTGSASYVPGLKSGTITLNGPQDSSGQSLHSEIVGSLDVDNSLQIMLLPDGDAVGKFAIFGVVDVTEYATDANVADAVGFSASTAADESVEMGFVLHELAAMTADTNGTTVDRGAGISSTLGLVAAVHITAYSGFTTVGFKVQHSTDNSVWSDVASFTNMTAIGAQLLRVATGTTINRYIRVVTDVTGTGSVTFLAAAAPR